MKSQLCAKGPNTGPIQFNGIWLQFFDPKPLLYTFLQYQLATSQYQMGLIRHFQATSQYPLTSAVDYILYFHPKMSWLGFFKQRMESNPGPLALIIINEERTSGILSNPFNMLDIVCCLMNEKPQVQSQLSSNFFTSTRLPKFQCQHKKLNGEKISMSGPT